MARRIAYQRDQLADSRALLSIIKVITYNNDAIIDVTIRNNDLIKDIVICID